MHARTLSLLSLVLLGCGGAFAPSLSSGDAGGGDSGNVDGSPFQDASPGPDEGPPDSGHPWSPVCPASLPTLGSACTADQAECEYGNAWWSVSCDPVVQCENGVWTTDQPSYEACSPEPGPNPSTCPASYAAVPQGTACADTGLDCVYAEAVCSCQVPLGGPVQIDGGEGASWGCLPGPGCPMPRPRLGSACTAEGTYCTYEACSYGQTCQGGVWHSAEEGCAAAGGGTGGQP